MSSLLGNCSTSPLRGTDRQRRYSSNYTLEMAQWFVRSATPPIIVIVYDVSIVIAYDVSIPKPFGK